MTGQPAGQAHHRGRVEKGLGNGCFDVMGERAPADNLAASISQAELVPLLAQSMPANYWASSVITPSFLHSQATATPVVPCTGAHGATPRWITSRPNLPRHASPKTQGAAMGGSR
jgi:hypothetical protein